MSTEAGPFRIHITEWSGRRGSNSRPLPWQGTFSNSYSQRADTGLPTCTYPQFPRGSTPNTRASTLTTRGPAPMTTSGNCPRRRPAAGRPGPREPGPRACIDGDEPYHTAPQLAIERSSWTDRLPKPRVFPQGSSRRERRSHWAACRRCTRAVVARVRPRHRLMPRRGKVELIGLA
jgi:hypothetical protein